MLSFISFSPTYRALHRADELAMSLVTLGELRFGAEKVSRVNVRWRRHRGINFATLAERHAGLDTALLEKSVPASMKQPK